MKQYITGINGREFLITTDDDGNVTSSVEVTKSELKPNDPAPEQATDSTGATQTTAATVEPAESKAKAFGKKLRKPLAVVGGVAAGLFLYGAGRKAGSDDSTANAYSEGYRDAVRDSGGGNSEPDNSEGEALE